MSEEKLEVGHQVEPVSDVLFCEVHPDRETNLRCNRCNRAMCTSCSVRTPVGYRCRECVREQQDVFYDSAWFDYVLSGGTALVLGAIGTFISGIFGFFLAIFISPVVGTLIARAAQSAVGNRRGRYMWLAVAAGVILGAVLVGLVTLRILSITWWIYVVLATGAAVGQLKSRWLRIGR